jgi:hypothetical protein
MLGCVSMFSEHLQQTVTLHKLASLPARASAAGVAANLANAVPDVKAPSTDASTILCITHQHPQASKTRSANRARSRTIRPPRPIF